MAYVYAIFSKHLNVRSINSDLAEYWLFKFGYCSFKSCLPDRFNLGFRKDKDDPTLTRRTLPLALYQDWEVVSSVEVRDRMQGEDIEGGIERWCEDNHYLRFGLHDAIDDEMRLLSKQVLSPTWSYSGNGIGEIRRIGGSSSVRLENALVGHPFNDPLGERTLRRVFAFIESELDVLATEVMVSPAIRQVPVVAQAPPCVGDGR